MDENQRLPAPGRETGDSREKSAGATASAPMTAKSRVGSAKPGRGHWTEPTSRFGGTDTTMISKETASARSLPNRTPGWSLRPRVVATSISTRAAPGGGGETGRRTPSWFDAQAVRNTSAAAAAKRRDSTLSRWL